MKKTISTSKLLYIAKKLWNSNGYDKSAYYTLLEWAEASGLSYDEEKAKFVPCPYCRADYHSFYKNRFAPYTV